MEGGTCQGARDLLGVRHLPSRWEEGWGAEGQPAPQSSGSRRGRCCPAGEQDGASPGVSQAPSSQKAAGATLRSGPRTQGALRKAQGRCGAGGRDLFKSVRACSPSGPRGPGTL